MSRRAYPTADVYEERERDFYSRPRQERNYDELDIDIRETRTRGPERRADTVVSDRRTERGGPRQPDFLREDYGKTSAGPLVIRREREREERDDDVVSRAPTAATRRRSIESVRTRAPERVDKEEIVIRERRGGPPYPSSERGGDFREEEIMFRDRARSRATSQAPSRVGGGRKEEIDITIRKQDEDARSRAPASPPPRSEYKSEYKEREVEEIRFRRGGGERPPPPRTVIEREEIDIRERRASPPRSEYRGRENREEIDIRIRETERPAPRARSASRGALVAKEKEEWIVRRRREPSPPPPPRDYEKEEIIIRRKERSPSPEPVREPTPEPPPPPQPEPIFRPPIIQEVITHHRHIDHGVERARSPSPAPPPQPPSPPPLREEDLEIEIHRTGTRNGKFYDEDIIFEREHVERRPREDKREIASRRSVSASTRRRSPSEAPTRRRGYDDDVAEEAEYYNRRVGARGYPGEAYNGATKDWGLVDIPPGTERVRMDGIGGGAQEISWQRYNGDRRSKFITGDRVYDTEFARERERENYPPPAPAPPPPAPRGGEEIDIRITRNTKEEPPAPPAKPKDKMWTEITKDLVIKEAVDEMGYSYEETDEFFYVIEYLRYEDVLHLVELTEDIRRQRRERIREIQWEREEIERLPKPKMIAAPPPPPVPAPPIGARSVYDERIYEREREYHYDREPGRRYRH